jgi:organic hydroperoxide reductase OsmC/OhrA
MAQHKVKLEWAAAPHAAQPGTYSRDHSVVFSQQAAVQASAAAEYLGNAALADPEQLLVSALSSCHMLVFLAICEGSGYAVESYTDDAVGEVSKSAEGYHWVSSITLRPRVTFAGEKQPSPEALSRMHDRAHRGCFIANSIKSAFVLELD